MVKIISALIGGRPMDRMGFAFTDVVSGKPVYYWRDQLNRIWMANGRWSVFRVGTDRAFPTPPRDRKQAGE